MQELNSMTTSDPEVKGVKETQPTKAQFQELLEDYRIGQEIENINFTKDGKKVSFTMPQEIKLRLSRNGSVSIRHYDGTSGEDINDYFASRDIDSPYTLEFQWGQETIKLTDTSAYGILHRFAKALSAITEFERE